MITVASDFRLRVPLGSHEGGIGVEAAEAIKRALTFEPRRPKIRFAKVETVTLYLEREDALIVPRGFASELVSIAAKQGHEIRFDPDPRATPDVNGPRGGGPMPSMGRWAYQERAVDAMIRGVQGVVVVPTGGGKTRIALRFVTRTGARTLILVHTKVLLNQWRDVIQDTLCAGAPVVVEMIQSAAPLLQERFDAVIVDEAHHVPAESFAAIVDALRAPYRFGLSATPERSDGLTGALHAIVGPPLFEIEPEKLIRLGVIVRPRVVRVPTQFYFGYYDAFSSGKPTHFNPRRWAAMLGAMASDVNRARLVADVAAADRGGLGAVLADRVEHCEVIRAACEARGLKVRCIYGSGSMRKRDAASALDAARSGALDYLIGTSVIGEGFDLPALGKVLIASPTRSAGKLLQRVGRALRSGGDEGKVATIYDFHDEREEILSNGYKSRVREYVRAYGVRPVEWEGA